MLPPLGSSTTTKSVITQEKDDQFTVNSLELSQRDDYQNDDGYDEDMYYEDEFNNKPGSTGKDNMISIADHFKRQLIQFTSGKQIIEECEKVMQEEFGITSDATTVGGAEEEGQRLLNFRELLSWKMPEHFCSTTSAKKHNVVAGNDGTILITNQINLYKLDFVTQRLKE